MVLKVVFNSFRIIFVEEKLRQREETWAGVGGRGDGHRAAAHR
jgi:hypothetical protein